MHWDATEHDHDEEMLISDVNNPLSAVETVRFRSVGIDFGSSTSHLMISRIVLRRMGGELSSRFVVVEREILHASPILLTPYVSTTAIDAAQLAGFVVATYQAAGLGPEAIDTGAVVVTGEAAKKENAANLIDVFAGEAGKFVCASAGPHLEALLAAHGSGAVRMSAGPDGHGPAETLLNVDIGGGTTKLAVVSGGRVGSTMAFNIGARLIAWNDDGRITRTEMAGKRIAAEAGFAAEPGAYVPAAARERIAMVMARALIDWIFGDSPSPLARDLLVTEPVSIPGNLDGLVFSGGVSEYIYGREQAEYGDLGPYLATAMRACLAELGDECPPVREAAHGIRATVIGASQYTVQVSGNTILLSRSDGLLPLRNLPVVRVHWHGATTPDRVRDAIQRSMRRFDLEETVEPLALAVHWPDGLHYAALRAFADGLVEAIPDRIAARSPLVLVFDKDVGCLIGNLLQRELQIGTDLISIDQVLLHDFDYIDIGTELPEQHAVPVVIKSLVFR